MVPGSSGIPPTMSVTRSVLASSGVVHTGHQIVLHHLGVLRAVNVVALGWGREQLRTNGLGDGATFCNTRSPWVPSWLW